MTGTEARCSQSGEFKYHFIFPFIGLVINSNQVNNVLEIRGTWTKEVTAAKGKVCRVLEIGIGTELARAGANSH